MIEKIITIKNKLGLHARPAALFVQTTSKFNSSLKVIKNGQNVDGKSIMGLMMLAAGLGTELRLLADGPDENELLSAVEELINRKFDEE
ncbi:MAG: HPr family phosphocarrier protein [Elusimicrobia bacterium]|nr:HPr family phosphocarrier protein [Elusimicrobiota bacterium]